MKWTKELVEKALIDCPGPPDDLTKAVAEGEETTKLFHYAAAKIRKEDPVAGLINGLGTTFLMGIMTGLELARVAEKERNP